MKTTNNSENIPSNEVGPEFKGKIIKCPDLIENIIDFCKGKIDFENFKNLFNQKKSSNLKLENNLIKIGERLKEYSITGEIINEKEIKFEKNIKLTLKYFLNNCIKENKTRNIGGIGDYYHFEINGNKYQLTKKEIEEIAWILYFIENEMNKVVDDTKNGVSKNAMNIVR